MSTVASVWTLFGLAGDPFFQDPLRADVEEESPRSTGRFVGRERDLTLVIGAVAGTDSEGSSRTIVEGEPGIGKTSFVNRAKSLLASARIPPVLTHEQPVRIRDDMTPRGFATDVLRALLRIHETGLSTQKSSRTKVPESQTAATFWRRVRRIVHGEDITSVGLSVAGVGGSVGHGRIAAEDAGGALYDEVAQAFELLSGPRKGDTRRRVLVHVNNLENLSIASVEGAARLAQNLRDYWLIPYSHWIFVGAAGIDEAVFRVTPQVSGIMPPPVILGPLSATEAEEALRLRYRALQRGRHFIAPVTSEAVETLYARYRGDLRNFLRVLSNGVRSAAVTPTAPLSAPDVLRAVASEYRRALGKRVGEDSISHLESTVRTLAMPASHLVFRATDVAEATDMRLDRATRFVSSLVVANVIRYDHREGRSVYYHLSGDTGVALGL